MYKKDKQGMIIVLIALTLFLALSVGFKFHSAVVALSIALTVMLVQVLSDLHQRLLRLEQQFSHPVHAHSIDIQKGVIYAAALVALFAYINTWMWIAGGALLVLLLCLIQTISAFHTRLLHLESADHIRDTSVSAQRLQTAEHVQNDVLGTDLSDQIAVSQDVPSTHIPWWKPAVEWMIHGNPILRVAVAILMVGVVLLLRFASEHWQLSLGLKLGFIAIAGAAVTALGYILQKKNQMFAVALQGVGLAIVFLTLVFSHHFAVIASLTTASILFAILLVITVFLSLKQQAIYLAILALGMAYAAPLVIPQYRPDVVFLFAYYLVINLAVAAVNFIQPWKILNQIAFFATMFIGGSAIAFYAEPAKFDMLDWILWLHIALFIWLSIRYSQVISKVSASQQSGLRLPPVLDVGLIFSVPVLGFTLHAYLVHESTQALTIGASALALTYAGLTFWIKKAHPQLSVLAKSFFILAVAFFALIFPLAKGAHWTAIGWVAQGTALIVWGVTERYRLSRYIGVILVLLSSIALFYQIWANEQFPTLSTVIYAIAQFISAFYLLQYNSKEQRYFSASIFSGIFLCLGMYAGAVAGVEIFVWQQHGLSPYLAIATLLLVVFSVFVHFKLQLKWQNLQLVLASLLLLLLLGEVIVSHVFTTLKWPDLLQQVTFLIAALALSAVFIAAQPQAENRLGYMSVWATFSWLTLSCVGLAIFPQMPIVALAFAPVLYAIWAYQSGKTMLLHQIPVWCLSLLWLIVLSIDTHSAEQYYFLPLLNLTDLLSLLVFVGVLWIVYQHVFHQERSLEWIFKISTILVGLLVLSSVVVRALHHYWGTPLWSTAIWSNGVVQLSLTLLWVVLAFILTTFSSRRMIRQLWFVGAALLGIVVLKLILLDLSQSATLTRVISFIGAGGVMLIIAYLAPLPPPQSVSTKSEEPKV